MKQQRITVTVAKILAEEAQKLIRKHEASKQKEVEKQVRKSNVFNRLKDFSKQITSLETRRHALELEIEKKFGVDLYIRSESNISVSVGSAAVPTVSDLKNRIIMLNHVDGVEVPKLVSTVVKETTDQTVQ